MKQTRWILFSFAFACVAAVIGLYYFVKVGPTVRAEIAHQLEDKFQTEFAAVPFEVAQITEVRATSRGPAPLTYIFEIPLKELSFLISDGKLIARVPGPRAERVESDKSLTNQELEALKKSPPVPSPETFHEAELALKSRIESWLESAAPSTKKSEILVEFQ